MHIQTPRTVIRSWRWSDAASLARHADSPEIANMLTDQFPSPYSQRDAEQWIEHCLGVSPGRLELALEIEGEACGGIGLTLRGDLERGTGVLGYWLGRRHWGRGLMTEAVAAFCRYAFGSLPLQRLQAETFSPNIASARVLEKVGFTHEGTRRRAVLKNGRTLDAEMFGLLRGEPIRGERPPTND